jgi:hypothetical protein
MIAKEERALESLARWYAGACDGDWEHQFGIEIQSLDNPGWAVHVDLRGTPLVGACFSPERHDASADDWYHVIVEEEQFRGYGDPSKLALLLRRFSAFANASAFDN